MPLGFRHGRRLIGAAVLFSSILLAQSRVIDCGSPADVFFSGGTTWTVTAGGLSDTTLRFGPTFSYRIPLSSDATVTLRFLEPTVTVPAGRIFSASFNDQIVVDKLDLVATAGPLVPYSLTIPASPRNGFLDIVFTTQMRSAVISSIEIVAAAVPPPSQIVDGEVPAGMIDGVNPAFTLAAPPVPASSLHLYKNGIRQKAGFDFDLAGNTITFVPLTIPQSSDTLLADYRK